MHKLLILAVLLAPKPGVEKIPAPVEKYSLADLNRFPSLVVCQGYYNLADAHCNWLQKEIILGEDKYCQWLQEAEECKDFWYHLRDSQNTNFCNSTRMDDLFQVFCYLSWDDWNAGVCPPPVPLWRFRSE